MTFGVVIVLYKPSSQQVERLANFCIAVSFPVVIVENALPQAHAGLFGDQTYLALNENKGIAAAINVGIAQLRQYHCRYGVIFDQDSQYSESLITRLIDTFVNHAPNNTAAIGPTIFCQYEKKTLRPLLRSANENTQYLHAVNQLISSGMTIDFDVYDNIGDMREALFIDGVDHEWCWRAVEQGYNLYQAADIQLLHQQGEGRLRLLGINFKVGKPFRLYYQFRNILVLSKLKHTPSYWKWRHLMAIPLRFLVNALALPERRKRVTFMARGIIDGLKGVGGKYKAR